MLVLSLGATVKTELDDGFYISWHESKTCQIHWS